MCGWFRRDRRSLSSSDSARLFLDVLVSAQPRLELAGHEIADALLLPVAGGLLGDELVFLGVGVAHRRLPGHFEREAVAVLGCLESARILAGDVLRDRH